MAMKRKSRACWAAATILAALVLVSCGYRLRGTGSYLPSYIKKIQIPVFKNNTTRYQLDLKVTQSVVDEFVARGRIEVTTDPKAADAILSGEINGFTATAVAFAGGLGAADHYTVTVVVSVTLKDSKTQQVIYANPWYAYNEDYEVPAGKDFESVETEALKKIAAKFARNLVITILEGF
jgi:outer membrane lipopolysaccharide assembly protein LptE/RlpB